MDERRGEKGGGEMNEGMMEGRVGMSVMAWGISALRRLWDVCREALEWREMKWIWKEEEEGRR